MHTIWIVEDEVAIADIVAGYLRREHYDVVIYTDGLQALRALSQAQPDLMLLDINLPIYTGIDIIADVRRQSNLPIIFLTASSDEASRLQGFELGADDYVTKPFSPRELVYRVKRMMARTYGHVTTLAVKSGMWINVDSYQLMTDQAVVDMTANEVKVLMTLIQEKPRVLTRQQIINLAFGVDYAATDRNIDTYIKSIRQKIEDDVKSPSLIMTKYGVGYYFGG